MTIHNHPWQDCPDLNPAAAPQPHAVVRLLRRLHSAGWQHTRYTTYGIDEHVWQRNRHALNEQRICVNENTDGWRVEHRADGMVVSVSGLAVADLDALAGYIGVFEPAPAPSWPVRRREPVTEDREADRG